MNARLRPISRVNQRPRSVLQTNSGIASRSRLEPLESRQLLNAAPVLNSIGNQTIEEGPWNLVVSAEDADAGDELTFSLGAGAPAGMTIAPGPSQRTATISWSVPDQAAISPNPFLIQVIVRDDGAGTLSNAQFVEITAVNAPPVWDGNFGLAPVRSGVPHLFTLSASDPAAADQAAHFYFEIDWDGNGAFDVLYWLPSGTQVSHTYDSAGSYPSNIRVTDKDGGSSVATETVHVWRLSQVGTELEWEGTDLDDRVEFYETAPGAVEVRTLLLKGLATNFLETFEGVVGPVRAVGRGGNDMLSAVGLSTIAAHLTGDEGSDSLLGGAGNDSLEGAAGDDALYGHAGDDTLHGYEGDDSLFGGEGQDALFGWIGVDELDGGSGGDRLLMQDWWWKDEDLTLNFDEREDAFIRFIDSVPDYPWDDRTASAVPWDYQKVLVIDRAFSQLVNRAGNWTLKYPNSDINCFLYTPIDTFIGFNYGPVFAGIKLIGLQSWDDTSLSSNDQVVATTIHEVAHNWDAQPEHDALGVAGSLVSAFRNLSDWTGSDPTPGFADPRRSDANFADNQGWYQAESDGWNYWYRASADFVGDMHDFDDGGPRISVHYGRANPLEDWAEAMETYFDVLRGAPASFNAGQQAKLDIIDEFLGEPNVPPVLAAIGNKTVSVGRPTSFNVSATDADLPSDELTFNLEPGSPIGASIDASTGLFTWTPTVPGNYQITILVSDGQGGSDSETITVTVAPTFSFLEMFPISEVVANEGNQTATVVQGIAPFVAPNTLISLRLETGAPFPAVIQPVAFTLPGGSWFAQVFINSSASYELHGPGSYPVTVIADFAGQISTQTFTVNVNELNVDPTLHSIGDATTTLGTQLAIPITAIDTDLPSNTLTYDLGSGAPQGATIESIRNRGILRWTPTAAQGPGNYQITVIVNDGQGGTAFETIDVTVFEGLNAIGDKTVDEQTELSFVAIAQPPGTWTYSLGPGYPAGASINPTTGLFTWTPTEAQGPGTYDITIFVSDGNGVTDSETITVTVNSVNDEPTVATPIADITVDEDATNSVINVSATFADVDIATDGDSLTYMVTGNTNTSLVAASLNGSSLTLNYLANQHGTATITVRATDELGDWVETSFLVTVNSIGVDLSFSDDFNRANGTSLGNNWVETLGNLGINSAHVVLFQNTESTAILNDVQVADVSIEALVDLAGVEVGRSIALMARSQGPGDQNAYWGVYYRSDSSYAAQIYKNIAGVPTPLRSVNVPGPVGTMRFEVFGTTLNLFFNDALVTSVIDDSFTGSGAVGVRQTGGSLDSFLAEEAFPPLSLPATLPFSDDFNRVDNSLFGPVWTERSGDAGIRNNMAGLYASDTSIVTLNGIHEADVSVSADFDITSVPAQFSSGLLARYNGPGDANTYMARLYRSDGGVFAAQIWKSVNGQYTPLRSVRVDSGQGNLRFEVVGDQLQLFFNNNYVAGTIDTSIPGPGMVGMRLLGGTADNFFATDLQGPPETPAPLPFVDNFNRAENYWLGEFWKERAGDLGVRNQRMELFAGEVSVATLNGITESDVDIRADVNVTSGGSVGLLARYTGPGDSNAYMGLLQPAGVGSFAAQIWKNTGAGWENLTHQLVSYGAGFMRFSVYGNYLELWFDGLLAGSVFDSSITGPGTVGIRQGGGSIDNFSASI